MKMNAKKVKESFMAVFLMSNSVKEEISEKNRQWESEMMNKRKRIRRSCKNLCIRGRLFSLFLYSVLLESFLCLFFTCRHTILFYYFLQILSLYIIFGVREKVVKCQTKIVTFKHTLTSA